MACQAGGQSEVSQRNAVSPGCFVRDVLVYTLTKCGLPENTLPPTIFRDKNYPDADFVKVAGASVLRTSLVMRDKWRLLFKSQRSSGGFSGPERIVHFLLRLAIHDAERQTSREKTAASRSQSLMQLLLASCNEIMLYCYHENIDLNFDILLLIASAYILCMKVISGYATANLEELFDNFDDISGYTERITDFITKFAIPYGSRDDVSYLFLVSVRKQYDDDLKKLRDRLRFLPPGVFSVITDEGSETSSDSDSLEPEELPTDSENGAVGEKESRVCRSTCIVNVSEGFDQMKQISRIYSEVGIEQDLGKMSLDANEDSREMHGAKCKMAQNEKDTGKKK